MLPDGRPADIFSTQLAWQSNNGLAATITPTMQAVFKVEIS